MCIQFNSKNILSLDTQKKMLGAENYNLMTMERRNY